MTNRTVLDRVLKAYQPLYLQGLLLDGQCRLPRNAAPSRDVSRRRMLLIALTGLRHLTSFDRSKR